MLAWLNACEIIVLMNPGIWYIVTVLPGFESIQLLNAVLYLDLNEEYTAISKGCNLLLQWGDVMPLDFA
ncbi:unnamed protein product [Parnassius apollo]|uniref:(apollo) hypothetical protein n=1 Tax=Parnassius apollo TaxID=110799 RepID=A0A8S3WR29_PARAO|nr:unnamed protein product [Parnassius apollo]